MKSPGKSKERTTGPREATGKLSHITTLDESETLDIRRQNIPFTKNISLRDVSKIVVKGKLLERPKRFSISLQNGSSFEPDNMVFVYDARFNFGSDTNIIVCNNRNGGIWGSEERSDYFPFVQKEKFKIKIKLNHDHYQIQVGSHVSKFDHRMPIYDVDTLRIDGNVELLDVQTK